MKALLLSVNPIHVENIFSGIKKFEFRKSRCRSVVDRVIFYSTAPTKLIVGEARISEIIEGTPDEIWKKTFCDAGISQMFYKGYYKDKKKAVAYRLVNVKKYLYPFSLADIGITHPPQSYTYIDINLDGIV